MSNDLYPLNAPASLDTVQRWWVEGYQHLRQGDTAKATYVWHQLTRAHPQCADGWLGLLACDREREDALWGLWHSREHVHEIMDVVGAQLWAAFYPSVGVAEPFTEQNGIHLAVIAFLLQDSDQIYRETMAGEAAFQFTGNELPTELDTRLLHNADTIEGLLAADLPGLTARQEGQLSLLRARYLAFFDRDDDGALLQLAFAEETPSLRAESLRLQALIVQQDNPTTALELIRQALTARTARNCDAIFWQTAALIAEAADDIDGAWLYWRETASAAPQWDHAMQAMEELEPLISSVDWTLLRWQAESEQLQPQEADRHVA